MNGVPPVDRELIMTDRHEHLDEGTIHAWLDGELPPDESARVESAVDSCPECAALVAEARGLIAASSRILSSLDAVPAGVIPGSSANVDQLAALRARRKAASRHWWRDPRFAAAASLILVAGVSSLVWRSSTTEPAVTRIDMAADSVQLAPAPTAVANAPASRPTEPSAVTREAPARAEKTEASLKAASPPALDVRARAASSSKTDSAAAQNVATRAPMPSEPRRVDTVMVGARQLSDSLEKRLARTDQAAAESQLRQQAAPRQAVQQQRFTDSISAAAQRRQFGASLRLSEVVVTGVGAAKADAPTLAGACFRLRVVPVALPGPSTPLVADSLKLLGEQVPVLSDPAWFRTQVYGVVRDTTLAWRLIDSVTVELRAQFGSDTSAVRFRTDGAASENRAVQGVRMASAMRIACPN